MTHELVFSGRALLTGAGSIQVTRRLKAALDDLLAVVPEGRRAPLIEQRELLDAAIAGNDWPEDERARVLADAQGIGSARGLRDT